MATSASKKVTLAESASPKSETASPKEAPITTKPKADKTDIQQSARAIIDRMKKLNTTAKEYAKELHSVLCDALAHALQHQNTTPLTTCFNLIHAVTAQRSVQTWIQTETNLRWRAAEGKTEAFRKPNGAPLQINLEWHKQHPFWNMPEVAGQQRPISYDIDGRIAGVIRLLDKAVLQDQVKATTPEEKQRAVTHLEMLKEFAEKKLAIPADKLAYKGPEAPGATESNPLSDIPDEDAEVAREAA